MARAHSFGWAAAGVLFIALGATLLSFKAWRRQPEGVNPPRQEGREGSKTSRSFTAEIEAARALIDLREFEAACRALYALLVEDPSRTTAYAPLARALEGLGRSDDAREIRTLANDDEFREREHVHTIERRLLARENDEDPKPTLDLTEHYLSLLRPGEARKRLEILQQRLGEGHPDLEVLVAYLEWIEGRHPAARDRLARLPVNGPRLSEKVRWRELWLRKRSAENEPSAEVLRLERRVLSSAWRASADARIELALAYRRVAALGAARRQLRLVERIAPDSSRASELLLELLDEPRWAFERLRVLRSLRAKSARTGDLGDATIDEKIEAIRARWRCPAS